MRSIFSSVSYSLLLSIAAISACALEHPAGALTSYGLMKDTEYDTTFMTFKRRPTKRRVMGERPYPYVVVTRKTDKIPAELGTKFGIKYEISGLLKQSYVKLHRVVRHPVMKLPSGETSTGSTRNIIRKASGDRVSGFIAFSFDYEFELVTGTWTFEVWFKDEKLIEKSFNVVSTDEGS